MTGDLISRLSVEGFEIDGDKDAWGALGSSVIDVGRRWGRYGGNSSAAASEVNAAEETVREPFKAQMRASFERGYPLCESPGEVSLLAWLLAQDYFPFFDYNPCCLLAGEGDQLKDYTVADKMSPPIATKKIKATNCITIMIR